MTDATRVVAQCEATINLLRLLRVAENHWTPTTRDERRRLMSRQVIFSIRAPESSGEPVALVELYSRAIAYTPRSDRRVTETWRPFEGGWYSAYKPIE
jgi:hypothetical protein